MLQARACKWAGEKPAFSLCCSEYSVAAPLPFTVTPHHAGVGCAMSSMGTGLGDLHWGIPVLWTVLPKRCKSLMQLRGRREAAICDRHLHAQQGGEGSCSLPFPPPLLPPVLESCLEVPWALGGVAAPCPKMTH